MKDCFPKQRKPAKISSLEVLNAVLYIVENGCKWRILPKEYGDWHVIYVQINRWANAGILQAVFLHWQQLSIIQVQVNMVSLDSTCIKVHPTLFRTVIAKPGGVLPAHGDNGQPHIAGMARHLLRDSGQRQRLFGAIEQPVTANPLRMGPLGDIANVVFQFRYFAAVFLDGAGDEWGGPASRRRYQIILVLKHLSAQGKVPEDLPDHGLLPFRSGIVRGVR